jgi:diguanylate cyclase (GGDEF)-like protein
VNPNAFGFAPEDEVGVAASGALSWTVLVADDEDDVHQATEYALRGVELHHRPLRLLHARSAGETLALLRRHPDTAVLLLDVVMESPRAGLEVVRRIREELGLRDLRIILRTGQSGDVPELQAMQEHDIDDWRAKTELTRARLQMALLAAIRAHEQLRQASASLRGLELIVLGIGREDPVEGFRAFAQGLLTQLAALACVTPEGALWVRSGGCPDGEVRLLGAIGRHLASLGRTLAQVPPDASRPMVEQALAERRSLFGASSAALFLAAAEGELVVSLDTPALLDPGRQEVLTGFFSRLAGGVDGLLLQARRERTAGLDPLLHIPNRNALLEAVDRRLAEAAGPDCLALVDLDRFSAFNNAFGEDFGDDLLRAATRRLRQAFPQGLLARVGSDMFGLFGAAASVGPVGVAEAFAEPLDVRGSPFRISATAGFARHDPAGRPLDAREMLKRASTALSRAKSSVPGGGLHFDEGMITDAAERARLLAALQEAVAAGTVEVAYQPIVDLGLDAVVAFEALARWPATADESPGPGVFIPLAEQTGLIVPLGALVLRRAVAHLAHLRSLGFTSLRMCVNVSAVQLRAEGFVDLVRAVLAEHRVPPSRLELEITESTAMQGPTQAIGNLETLRELGIGVALDDFGTGFSSLASLGELPLDRLKVDRSFVEGLGRNTRSVRIAETITRLGHALGIPVVAEGVEDAGRLAKLRRLGCQEAQGFLLARPMPAEASVDWLRDRKGSEADVA